MPRPLIKQEPPKRDISLCIVLNPNLTFYSPLRVCRSLKDTNYLQTAYQLISAMDPTELADPNGFPSSRLVFMLEEPSLQDNQLPTVSALIVIESGDESEATQQEVRCISKYL
jgi:hypothetical protein